MQRVNIRAVAGLIHDADFGTEAAARVDLLEYLFSGGGEWPHNSREIVRPILAGAFPFLNVFAGRTEPERERWIRSIEAFHGATVPLEPLQLLYYLPGTFPDDEACRTLIQAFKERRWALNREVKQTDPVTAANLYALIRQCITRTFSPAAKVPT